MNKIYKVIGDLRDEFVKMTYGLIQDKNEIDEVVQELMLYFLQMNPETLKKIYKKDGKKGLIRFGAVVIKRSIQSKNSRYYYKFKKYYTRIDNRSDYTSTITKQQWLQNIPDKNIKDNYYKLEQIDMILDDIYWYDRELFKLYYYEDNTLDSLAKKTNIGRNSLFNTIDNVRNLIKEKLNE
ncbi:MAG: hypothetical protein GOVbin3264_26 [Prokaryotic dsDNA virus sp.]|nr:MAG: hypothetical protein GOVbin3264_26 [Prokaryotic dsDNA virus sp.]|tara:strand:- start:908 stop:1450 length:543 start_codon:yes stop_codon:yes gene_type:complete